jgi:hypothetical protein
MPKIKYIDQKFTRSSKVLIDQANEIIQQYTAQGYQLTLRQLYYQFVARDLLANKQSNYHRLGSIINDARLAGLIDWNAIEDRLRSTLSLPTWDSPTEILEGCAQQFRVDLWEGQDTVVEVWVEKDALVGVIERPCHAYNAPYLACRGYTSQSAMWGAAQRMIRRKKQDKQNTIVLHFGDHDPSGVDMTRDINDRIDLFTAAHGTPGCCEIRRMALNMDQVRQYDPPPNPAKSSDARFEGYTREYGDECWELDALEPRVIETLVREEIESIIDVELMDERKGVQQEHRTALTAIAERYDDVHEAIREGRL